MRLACPSCQQEPDVSAKAGDACRACGATLVGGQKTTAGVTLPKADSTDAQDLPPLELDVVDLGERTGAPPVMAPRRREPTREPAPEPLTIQAPEVETKLELDADWQREKAARQQQPSEGAKRVARDAAMRSPPSSGGPPWLLILLVAAGLGAGGYYLMTRKSASSTAVPKQGVTIRIVGQPGTPVTIDGTPVGKTPLSLERPAGTKQIVIGTPKVTIKVVPDRDLTVDVTTPP